MLKPHQIDEMRRSLTEAARDVYATYTERDAERKTEPEGSRRVIGLALPDVTRATDRDLLRFHY